MQYYDIAGSKFGYWANDGRLITIKLGSTFIEKFNAVNAANNFLHQN